MPGEIRHSLTPMDSASTTGFALIICTYHHPEYNDIRMKYIMTGTGSERSPPAGIVLFMIAIDRVRVHDRTA
jgi:hypothetical protein